MTRNGRFPGKFLAYGSHPIGVQVQGLYDHVVDLAAHGVFVDIGEGLERFVFNPVEPAGKEVKLGFAEGGEVGDGQGAKSVEGEGRV